LDAIALKSGSASFLVTATSLTTMSYQWYFGSTALSGANQAGLTLVNITNGNAGLYWVRVYNAGGYVDSRQATLTVLNNAPVGSNDTYGTFRKLTLTVPASTGVLANDTDADGDPLVAQRLTWPNHGNLTFNANGSFVYKPLGNYYGPDSFTYRPYDGQATGNVVTVSITVVNTNYPPIAVNDTASTWKNFSVAVPVLNNDSDQEGTPLVITDASTTNGTAAIVDSNVVYTPVSNFVGTAWVNYTITDGTNFASAVVTITVRDGYPAPAVQTLGASNVIATAATLVGSVDTRGDQTSYYFQYGLTTNYTSFSVTNVLPVNAPTAGAFGGAAPLTPSTLYHFRIIATNSGGTTMGQDATFTTPGPAVMAPLLGSLSTPGNMLLSFTNTPGLIFTVVSCNDLNLNTWSVLGPMTEVSPGQYQFNDPSPATNSQCYYRVRSP
jgi:hypothetical protein